MKPFSIVLIFLFFTLTLFAQAPDAFNYQAVARDINNNPIPNQSIGLEITIIQDSLLGETVYQETHDVLTSALGLFNIKIGTGTPVLGSFETINWEKGTFFIQTGMDENGGDDYQIIGASQFLSVPYAQYANNGSKWKEVEPEFRINYPNKVNIGFENSPYFDYNLNISDDFDGTSGLSVINTNPTGRSLLLIGERNLQNYLYIGYNNSNYSPQFSAYEASSGIFFTGAANGVKHITPNGDVSFVTGGLEIDFTRLIIRESGNIGVGTTTPASKLQVSDGDIYIDDINNGVIMKSPNGQCWRYTPDNTGQLVPQAITCPN